jgi:hypothetical protein
LRLLVPLSAALASGPVAASCGSAFCSVNTGWTTESALIGTGSVLDLRFEYIDQDHLRSGSGSATEDEAGEQHHEELETINRNSLVTFSHSFKSSWGVWIVVPLVDRDHRHLHHHGGAEVPESWSFTDIGDVSLIGRYRLPFHGTAERRVTAGINFGLQLPTGATDVTNPDGEQAERSLQPGSGTMGGAIGAYVQQKLPAHGSLWFAQVYYRHALEADQGYEPGSHFGMDVGYNHNFGDHLGAVVQLNLVLRGRDEGPAAEPEDSGGEYLSLSPGLNYTLGRLWQAYGYIQLPLYQHVNGVQLTADWSVVAGVSRRFR